MQHGGGRRFLLAALHSVAKRVSHGQAYPPMRSVPVCPETAPARLRRHDPQLRSRFRAIAGCPGVERIARLGVLVLAEAWEPCTLLPASGKWARPALASTRGPCGAGGRAFRGLTRSATEWSAARRKPIRAAAMPPRSPILLALRPVGFRRATAENFRPEIFDARATLREQSGSTLGRREHQSLNSVPVC